MTCIRRHTICLIIKLKTNQATKQTNEHTKNSISHFLIAVLIDRQPCNKLLPLIYDTLIINIVLTHYRKQRIPSDQYPICQINGVHISTLHNSQIHLIFPLIISVSNALVLQGSYYSSVIMSHISEAFYVHKKSFYLLAQESSQEVQNVILIHSSI